MEDAGFKVFAVLLIIAISTGIFGALPLSFPHYSGTIVSINNSYKADGYTYINYSVILSNVPSQVSKQNVVVDCDFYHLGSTITFTTNANVFGWNPWWQNLSPNLAPGCTPSRGFF